MTNVEQVKSRARGLVLDQLGLRATEAGRMLQAHVTNLESMSDTMREQGLGATAGVIEYAAGRLGVASDYLMSTSGERIALDLENVARENMMATGAIGLVFGLTAARLLKASASDRRQRYAP